MDSVQHLVLSLLREEQAKVSYFYQYGSNLFIYFYIHYFFGGKKVLDTGEIIKYCRGNEKQYTIIMSNKQAINTYSNNNYRG